MTADSVTPAGTHRPSVTLHFAQSLDGRIATRSGRSQWLSGSESRKLSHELRAAHEAVVVGIGTVLADDPLLTVRLVSGPSPTRVVVDSRLRTPVSARLLGDRTPSTIIATTDRAAASRQAALVDAGAEVVVLPVEPSGRVDLKALLTTLGERGIASVLVEGGSGIITSLLRLRLVDRVVVCICPKLVGAGIDACGDLHVDDLSHALSFSSVSYQQLGLDMIFDGRMAKG